MSGGALDYAFTHMENAAESIRKKRMGTLWDALADHCEFLSHVLYKAEWALSGDSSYEEAEKMIRGLITPQMELEVAVDEGKRVLAELGKALERAEE